MLGAKLRGETKTLTNLGRKIPLHSTSPSPIGQSHKYSNNNPEISPIGANSYNPDFNSKKAQIKLELRLLQDSPTAKYSLGLSSIFGLANSCESPPKKIGNFTQETEKYISPQDKLVNLCSSPRISLKPLNSVVNCITRAGFKIKGGEMSCGKMIRTCCAIVKPNLQNIKGKFLFAVCEGHGPFGHQISNCISLNYTKMIELLIPSNGKPEKLTEALLTSDQKLIELLKNSGQELNFSGCSVLTIIVTGEILTISNIGDCQAVMGSFKNEWTGNALCGCHNLKNSDERTRVLECGAEIRIEEKDKNEKFYGGPARGYGFEQTRSIGFNVGRSNGIISSAETFNYSLEITDKFVIVGNSNFWKVMNYSEAVTIATEGWALKKTDLCCKMLIKEAQSRLNDDSARNQFLVLVFFINL